MRHFPKTRKYWPFKKNWKKLLHWNPDDGAESAVIGTITTLGTLMGLLGTVIGMIRSFAALSAGGGTDSMALSQGISEALINTHSVS